jgi:DNA-binding NarL/FixJ family response regulator
MNGRESVHIITDQLLAAVRSIATGKGGAIISLSRAAIGRLDDQRSSPLSERQREILILAARGKSNRQIASSLHLSESTIQRHLSNVYSRLRVGSRSEATRRALSEGWITPRDVIGRS